MTARAPDLAAFDWIVIASSSGKDSQSMLDYMAELATVAGVRDRVVVVHADLGRVEWAGTRELAREQAHHYGFRFEIVERLQGDILQHAEAMGHWPKPDSRWCTSDHKRGQIFTLFTKLALEWRQGLMRTGRVDRACRILNTMGFRAEESPGRKKRCKRPLTIDRSASNGRREVTVWYPIHNWTEAQVWERIRASGVRYHRAYDLGMKRLSCVFCIFAPEAALLIAGRHNRALLDEYIRVEDTIDESFQYKSGKRVYLRVIRDRIESGEAPSDDDGKWNM